MRTATQIQEEINDLRDELDGIVAVTEKEERDPSAEEAARLTSLADELIPDLQAKLKTALKIDRERKERAATRLKEQLDVQATQKPDEDTGRRFAGSIKVPAKAKNYGTLKAFQGPEAEKEAYISGQWALANLFGKPHAADWCRHHGINATLTTSDNSKGGFVSMPDELLRTIIRLREERGVFPRFANNIPMGSDIIRVPRLLTDVTAYWVGEGGGTGSDITASDPALGEAELMARKLGALTKVSSELDEEAVVSIGDMVATSMAYQMAEKVDQAGFNGDGTSTFGGVLGLKNALDSAAIVTALTGNTAATTLDIDDFLSVLGSIPQYPGASNRWFMHSAVYYAACQRLMAAAGGSNMMDIANGVSTPMFLGYPVTFTNVMTSTITTSVSTILAYFGDLRLAASYGTRRSQRVEVSTERYFESDLIGIKMTERIAINVHERGDGANNRPILALRTAAS